MTEIFILKTEIMQMEIIWFIFYFTESRLPRAILQNKAGIEYRFFKCGGSPGFRHRDRKLGEEGGNQNCKRAPPTPHPHHAGLLHRRGKPPPAPHWGVLSRPRSPDLSVPRTGWTLRLVTSPNASNSCISDRMREVASQWHFLA